ncbi:class IV adenylate cyclase [Granulicella sp. L46]|jgi:adenylate cyclase, class 2|uniref:class IV adenylate cyclase n=1 Tax=Granulicella sp. L46 TaxID=1641865 RepID=UPI0020B13470|nr:class IV adenylate cyclase [Granulicella sp. L46]
MVAFRTRFQTYTDAMQAAEIELKFSVADIRELRSTADALGFKLVTDRTFESNVLYDSSDRQLRTQRQILRLRHYGNRCTVTHKRQAEGGDGDLRYKTRIETESVVEDCDALAEIFIQLGYRPVFRYEKFRTEWAMDEGHLVLDETPIGVWAELEGQPAWIDAMLEKLCIAPELRTIQSYGSLFLRWKEETGSAVENLTFDEIAAYAEVSTLAVVAH